MKILARAISVACILLGILLVSRMLVLENQYAQTMPRGRDVIAGRTNAVTVWHATRVYVNDAEVRALDTADTYFTFGWPFVILGVLLLATSREHRIPAGPVAEAESPWTARR